MNYSNEPERWPSPDFDENDQPHFLFMVTPPRSGSTALAEILNTSPRVMTLQGRGEGQWLVPGLCEQDRWNPKKDVNYLSVKATWLSRYQKMKETNPAIDVVIEKSPPNMMRIEKMTSQFRNFSLIANNRDPYANCASTLYRLHKADELTSGERKDVIGDFVRLWIMRSRKIHDIVAGFGAPLLTYEEFCRAPDSLRKMIEGVSGLAESISTDANVNVKDYEPQPIVNQNERQISKLKDWEIDHISDSLSDCEGLLGFFGYQILK